MQARRTRVQLNFDRNEKTSIEPDTLLWEAISVRSDISSRLVIKKSIAMVEFIDWWLKMLIAMVKIIDYQPQPDRFLDHQSWTHTTFDWYGLPYFVPDFKDQ